MANNVMILYTIPLLIFISLSAQNCNTARSTSSEKNNEGTTIYMILPGDTIRHSLGFFGDEDRIRIISHPKYNVFTDFCSSNRQPLVYCYSPARAYADYDTVIFKKTIGSSGSHEGNDHEIIQLVFHIKS